MKTWDSCEIVEVNFSETQYGGDFSNDYDLEWQDAQGAWHVNFVDGGQS